MTKELDLIGKRFGRLKVLSRDHHVISRGHKKIFWLCQCDCGDIVIRRGDYLRSHHTLSCGCLQREIQENARFMKQAVDLSDRRFGRLVVLARAPNNASKNAVWTCRCDCGTVKDIRADLLTKRQKPSLSCGCLAIELARSATVTHGMSQTPIYRIYQTMKKRCNDPAHPSYKGHGAKGIYICERWQESFENFYADMGPRPSPKHSLDRIDNTGPYSPENCRWATASTQGRNTSRNKMVTIDGVTMCVVEWCELFGVDKSKPYTMKYWGKRRNITTVDQALEHLYAEWKAAGN